MTAEETGARASRWGLGDAAAGYALAFVLTAVCSPLIFAATGVDTGATDVPLRTVALLQVPFDGGMLATAVYAAYWKGRGVVRDFGFRLVPRDLLGVFAGLAAQWGALLIYLPLIWTKVIDTEDVSKPARDLTNKAHGAGGVVLLVVIVVIAAPIVEELFFRGLVLRSLERRFGTTWALWGSSALFAAAHLEPLQFPALLVFGLVAGYLATRTGRLGPGICAHIAFNALAVASLLS